MSFFNRKTADLEAKGIDPARVPPGQYVTDRFPVLHAGRTPKVDDATYDLTFSGLDGEDRVFSLDELRAMPTTTLTYDIHCVTKWSKLDTQWEGVAVADLVSQLDVPASATHVLMTAEQGFTANLPLADFLRPENLFAWKFDGEDLDIEHGWPLRLVVPHLYFWKSVKWIRGVRFQDHDEPGFWERNGYHMYGDPFKEQRYWGD